MSQSTSIQRSWGSNCSADPIITPATPTWRSSGRIGDAYIELVYDLEDHPPYQIGNRYEHLALEVDGDLAALCEKLKSQGVKVLKGPKKSPGGTRSIAFVEDPNGIPVELLEPKK